MLQQLQIKVKLMREQSRKMRAEVEMYLAIATAAEAVKVQPHRDRLRSLVNYLAQNNHTEDNKGKCEQMKHFFCVVQNKNKGNWRGQGSRYISNNAIEFNGLPWNSKVRQVSVLPLPERE